MKKRENKPDTGNLNPVNIPTHGIETRINEAAKPLGTRKKAADAMGVSPDTLQRYIRGEVRPSLDAVVLLARAAGLSVEWLATGQGDKQPGQRAREEPGSIGRKGVEAIFIRNAVKIAERRLEQHLDLDTKARIIADIAQDLQDMHDQEWGRETPQQHED